MSHNILGFNTIAEQKIAFPTEIGWCWFIETN